MNTSTRSAAVTVLLVGVLGLAACDGETGAGGSEPTVTLPVETTPTAAPTPTTVPPPAASTTTSAADPTATPENPGAACVIGQWTLDTDNAGLQLLAFLLDAGVASTGDVNVTGSSELTISADGRFQLEPDLTLTATFSMGGPEVALTQIHSGRFDADWGMTDATTMKFDVIYLADYTVDQSMSMGGTVIDVPIDIPSSFASDIPLTISCEGDTLIYSPPDAPITSVWRRVG